MRDQTIETAATVGDDAPAAASAKTRLSEYVDYFSSDIDALSAQSSRLADLSVSFPGLLFALATSYGTKAERRRAIAAVIDGVPLKRICADLGLAMWLRPLPPQAFAAPLLSLPDTPELTRRISNFVPTEPAAGRAWLHRISDAYCFGGPDYMLWMGRQKRLPFKAEGADALMLLGSYVWASRRRHTVAGDLVTMPFAKTMSLKKAYDMARVWEQRVDMAITLGDGVQDTWFAEAEVNGLTFTPLRTLTDFLDEAATMGNCLDQYAGPINNTHVRVFSVRRGETVVANLELAPHDDDCLMPTIEQLRGPRNNRAAPDVWQATYAWLGAQKFSSFPGPSHGGRASAASTWKKIWNPLFADLAPNQPLRQRARQFAKRAHGHSGVMREASRVALDI